MATTKKTTTTKTVTTAKKIAPEPTEGMKRAGMKYAYEKNIDGDTVLMLVSE